MTAEAQFRSRTNRIPGRELTEPLSRVYDRVLICDASGELHWTGDGWASGCRGPAFAPALRDSGACLEMQLELRERGLLFSPAATTRDGGVYDLTVFPLRDAGGEALHVVIGRPVSERRAPPAPRPICDDHPDATLGVDARGFIRYANRAAGELIGLDPANLCGGAAVALASDSEGLMRLLHALAGGVGANFPLQLRRPGAEPVAITVALAPSDSEDGGAVLAFRRCEERSLSELARRNDELEHCVNTLAHDLRSPLVALLGFSRLLRQDYGDRLDATGTHFLDRIEQSGQTMEALVRDLLELSRIGQPSEAPGLVDPRGVLQQVGAELKPRFDEAGLQLLLPDDPPLVYCDRTRLYQIFSNLLANAVDHAGNPTDRRVLVSIEEAEEHHRICVRDFGRGVAAEHHERIFEPFQSLGIRRDRACGTGMGLAIVRRIAESRGGAAWVESRRSGGARFLVTLPRG